MDAVTVTKLMETPNHYVAHLTCISDATGETAVVKVDKSALVASDGAEPAALDIERVRWSVQGFKSVRLLWDHTTPDVALVLAGNGSEDFAGAGGIFVDALRGPGFKVDPRSAGGAGDLLLTSDGAAAGATYDITLWLRKQAA